tara:strand:- start:5 stop:586 length:582 start_codon:yes stop_codon:yes gene_type:complete
MRTPNVFNILLRSDDSENATTPQSCNFNLGSVLQNAPNLINFQNQSYCKIKVRHFTINATSAANQPLEDVGAVEIRINTPNPNTLQSAASNTQFNILSSSLIGIVATDDASFTRTNNYYDNDYFYTGNPFQGTINISLHDSSSGANIAGLTQAHPYSLLLEVVYDNNPARVTDNSGVLNTKTVDYNLNGGYKY